MNIALPRNILFAALLATPALALAAPVTYQIDPTHTNVTATWNHFGFSNPSAHFGDASGTIVYDPENVSASSVEVVLPLSGLNSYVDDFDAHLRNADFFEADKYPEARFKSTAVKSTGEGKLEITGELTIKDTTKPVVLDATVNKVAANPMSGQPTAGFDAVATIKRTDFGLGLYAPNVSDEVKLRITTEAAVPKKEG